MTSLLLSSLKAGTLTIMLNRPERANAFTLESYVTDAWTKQETNIVYFDNVVIARRYIGPAGNGPPKN